MKSANWCNCTRAGGAMMRDKGFTLVELLVVIAIFGILLGMAGFQMSSWLGKARVEEETKKLYADLANARLRAMNRNRIHFVTMTANRYEIWEDTSPGPDGNGALEAVAGSDTQVVGVDLRDPLLSSSSYAGFNFDPRGLMSGLGTIRFQNSYEARIDCIAVSSTRIRLGRWDGANCS